LAGTLAGEFGEIALLDDALLDGALDVSLDPGFNPIAGDTFQIISAANVAGTFDSTTLPLLGEGLVWDVEYDVDSFSLQVLFAADFDQDGEVDTDDLTIWQTNYGSTSAPQSSGDADEDGDVDGADFLFWQRQFGSQSSPISAASVPEPTSFSLFILTLLSLSLGRPRKLLA